MAEWFLKMIEPAHVLSLQIIFGLMNVVLNSFTLFWVYNLYQREKMRRELVEALETAFLRKAREQTIVEHQIEAIERGKHDDGCSQTD